MAGWLWSRAARLAGLGVLSTDTQDERLQKAILTFCTSMGVIAGALWGLLYIALGYPAPGAIPLGYSVMALASLVHFGRTKRYGFFRFSQLLLLLILPFLLQWSLGGFAASSAVCLWAILPPLGALMFWGTRQAVPWFLAYLGLMLFSSIIEGVVAQHAAEFPPGVLVAFYGMNLGAVSTIAYLLLQYFVRERERAMAALAEQHALVQQERDRSEQLLLNILPKPIAERLKRDSTAIADAFDDVTVLFADLVDFTRLSSRVTPEELVLLLNDIFTSFDEQAERHGLEKIKTIGDAYMVVAGLPVPRPDHAHAAAEMALGMIEALGRYRTKDGEQLSVRIGINSGPVVAGVIGRKKFIYDLWGDAVNTASRMESQGLAGVIQVTEDTYLRLRDTYDFEARGTIQVKGKGEMRTYLLTGRRATTAPRVAPALAG